MNGNIPYDEMDANIVGLAKVLNSMIVDISTGEIEEKPESVKAKSGRIGGLKGGHARAEKLTPEERSSIAKKAAEARWGKS